MDRLVPITESNRAAPPPLSLLPRQVIVLTVILTLVGTGLRFFRLSDQSLWNDEVMSIVTATAPLDQVAACSAAMNNPLPGYFLLLRPLLILLPFFPYDSNSIEFNVRLISAVAGSLSIPLFMAVVYLWHQRLGAALAAGLLLATNPLHIWYSQEARSYALMLFLGLGVLLAFELAQLHRRKRWWGLYLLSALGAISLHKTGVIFPAACMLWHGWRVHRLKEPRAKLLVHAPILLGAFVVLLLKSYPSYGRSNSVWEIGYTFMTFLGGYSLGPPVADIQYYGGLGALSHHWFQTGILLAVSLAVILACALNFRVLISGRETALMAMGIGSAAAYSIVSGFPYNVRYVLPAMLAFLALVSTFAGHLPKPGFARLALACVLATALWADAQWFGKPAYRKPDARAVVQWLVKHRDRVKSWTVLPEYLSLPVKWYLAQLDRELLPRQCPAQNDRTTSFPPVPDVLILGRRHHLLEPDKLIANYQRAAGQIQTNHSFTGFEIYMAVPNPSLAPAARQ